MIVAGFKIAIGTLLSIIVALFAVVALIILTKVIFAIFFLAAISPDGFSYLCNRLEFWFGLSLIASAIIMFARSR